MYEINVKEGFILQNEEIAILKKISNIATPLFLYFFVFTVITLEYAP